MKYEYLFKTIGKEGKYSLELKCLFFILILYVPGLISTFLAGTWYTYIFDDWRRFVAILFIGVFMWLMVRFLKRIDDKFQHVNQIISPPRRKKGQRGYEEWENWKKKIGNYKKWVDRMHDIAYLWCYSYAFVGVSAVIIAYIFTPIDIKGGWIQGNLLNELYYRVWWIFLAFLTGASLQFIFEAFWVIRKYCRDVISHREILPLDPDRTGGLTELGRLSLDLDLIVALPSVVFPIYLLGRGSEYLISISKSFWVGISVVYALLLVFVFFVSISPAHDDMARAKNDCLLKIHNEYKDMHEKILHKLEPKELMAPEEYKRLSGLYDLYDRVKGMAVWPLDFQTTLRFSITSLLPLVSIGISISIPG